MDIDVIKIFQKLFLKELNLPESYGRDKFGFVIPSVYLISPSANLGDTDKLQIGIQSIGSNCISNQTNYATIENVYTEVSELVIDDIIQIDIMSRNNEARDRRFEIIAALNSTYSKQLQEEYCFKIFQIPERMSYTGLLETSAYIYRYTLTINCQYLKRYTKPVDYYNKFNIEVNKDDLKHPQKIKFE